MAPALSRHSRLIRALKIGLPVLAVGLLAALILLSQTIDPTRPANIPGLDVGQLVREQGIGQPSHFGKTPDGATLTLTADRIGNTSDSAGDLFARNIKANILNPDASSMDFEAPSARFEEASGEVVFTDGVRVITSDDILLTTPVLRGNRDLTWLVAPEQVYATTSAGEVVADEMEVMRDPTTARYRFVFQGNVRVVYDPGN